MKVKVLITKDRFIIREVIKQRYDKIKVSYDKAKKKNSKISAQKVTQYENMKRTYETFSNELLSDLNVFEEQRLDTFDDAIIAVLIISHLSVLIPLVLNFSASPVDESGFFSTF